MPLIDHHEPYDTKVTYTIRANLTLGTRKFSLSPEETSDIKEALFMARLLVNRGFSVQASRTISYERKDGYQSDDPPDVKELDLNDLERLSLQFSLQGEKIPEKKYPVYVEPSSRAVDIGD